MGKTIVGYTKELEVCLHIGPYLLLRFTLLLQYYYVVEVVSSFLTEVVYTIMSEVMYSSFAKGLFIAEAETLFIAKIPSTNLSEGVAKVVSRNVRVSTSPNDPKKRCLIMWLKWSLLKWL